MLNMRVKNLGYKFVGVDRKEINQTIQMVTGQIKSSRQLSQADDRNITLKKNYIFSSVQGNACCFSFWNNNKHSS